MTRITIADVTLAVEAVGFAQVGSTYILGHGNDVDYLVLVEDQQEAARVLCADMGFDWDGGNALGKIGYDSGDFISLRLGKMNVLVIDDRAFFEDFKAAAEVCKYLATRSFDLPALMHTRAGRVAIHKMVLYGTKYDKV